MRFLEANGTFLSLNYCSNDLCVCNLRLLHSVTLVIDQDVQGIFSYSIYKFLIAFLNYGLSQFQCGTLDI